MTPPDPRPCPSATVTGGVGVTRRTPVPTGPRAAHPRATLAIVLVSYFLVLLDNSVVFTGLPQIQAGLGLSAAGLSWTQDTYALVFGGLLLLGARLGDVFGRRRVFVWGLVIFVGASALVGAAQDGSWMIASRALQGVGAAIVGPSSLALLMAGFPEGAGRSRAVALYGVTAGVGSSLGLLVGGASATWISWRAGFFLNLPVGGAMILLATRFLPETSPRRGAFDLRGAMLATLGTGALTFGVIWSADRGWWDPVATGSVVAAAVLLAALVVNERRASQPILPLRLFGDRRRSAAYFCRAAYVGAIIGFFFFTSQLMQTVLGFNAFEAGLGFLPMTVANFAVAMAVSRVLGRHSGASVLAVGVALALLGVAWLSRAGAGDGYLAAVALPMVLIGAGQGLALAPLTSFGIAGAAAEDAGAASGVVNTFHQFGVALGLAVLVAVSAGGRDLPDRVSRALLGSTALLGACLVVVLAVIAPAGRASRPTQ